MESVLLLVAILLFVFLWRSGVPQVVRAYNGEAISNARRVGYFWFWPLRQHRLGGAVRFRSMGAICLVFANSNGMTIQPVFLPWPSAAHVPWSDVWVEEVNSIFGMSTKIGFLGCPDICFRVTSAFRRNVERAIQAPLPL